MLQIRKILNFKIGPKHREFLVLNELNTYTPKVSLSMLYIVYICTVQNIYSWQSLFYKHNYENNTVGGSEM